MASNKNQFNRFKEYVEDDEESGHDTDSAEDTTQEEVGSLGQGRAGRPSNRTGVLGGGIGGIGGEALGNSRHGLGLSGIGGKPSGGIGGLGGIGGKPTSSIGGLGGIVGKPTGGISGIGGIGGIGRIGGIGGASSLGSSRPGTGFGGSASGNNMGTTSKPTGTFGAAGAAGAAGVGGTSKSAGGMNRSMGILGAGTKLSDATNTRLPDSGLHDVGPVADAIKRVAEMQSEMYSSIKRTEKEHISAYKSMLKLMQELSERSISGYKEVSDRLAQQTDEQMAVQQSLEMLVDNLDKEMLRSEQDAYILIPGSGQHTVTPEEVVQMLKGKTVHVYGSVRMLAGATNIEQASAPVSADEPVACHEPSESPGGDNGSPPADAMHSLRVNANHSPQPYELKTMTPTSETHDD